VATPVPTAIRSALDTVRRRLPGLIGFRVLSWAVSTAVLAPVVAWATGWLIETSGATAVANVAIASFLLSPAGLATLALGGLLVVATTHLEQAGLVRLAAARPRELRATRVLVETLRWLPDLVRIGLAQLAVAVAVLIPVLLVVAGLWFGLLGEHDINWYLATRPPAFLVAAGVAGLLAVIAAGIALLLLLRWTLAVPVVVFEGLGARQALRRSRDLVASDRWAVLRTLATWWLATTLVGLAAGAVWAFLEDELLGVALTLLRQPIAAVGLLVAVEVAAGVVLAFAAVTVHAVLRLQLYRELAGVEASSSPADVETERAFQRAPRLAPLLWAAVVVLLGGTAVAAYGLVDRLDLERDVLVTAHRGSSRRAPENTLAALRAAVSDGADLVEIDVQTTSDGEVVVIHDFDLMRLASVGRRVHEMTLEEIRGLDVGSWFDPAFADQRVPTLREAVEAVRGGSRLLVEIKDDGSDPELGRRVAEVLRDEGFLEQCLVMSLELRAVRSFQQHAPTVPVGLIVGQSLGDLVREPVDFLAVRAALATPDLVARAHAADKQVHAWTVNDRRLATALVDRGVDNLISDVPLDMREVLAELAELEPAERLLLGYHNRHLP
jgi:glycerophosphoryl diester phosphodiesterase